jgi:integrase
MREKRGGYELVVYLGPDPVVPGKKRYRSRMFKGGKREAGRELARLVAEVGEERKPPTDAPLRIVVDTYLAHLKASGRAHGTIVNYERARDHLEKLKPWTVSIADLTADHLDAVYRHLLEAKVGRSTVAKVHELVSGALRYAVRKGWTTRNVAEFADPPSLPSRDVDPPDVDQVRNLIAMAEERNPTVAALIFLAVTTGARRGELCALRWRDVDFEHKALLIRASIGDQGGLIERRPTKTGKPRRIGLDTISILALKLHAERCEKAAADIGLQLDGRSYVFSQHPDGAEPYRPNKVSGFFYRLRNAAGLDKVRLHDLRHFAATTMLTEGVDVRTVAGRLGHADARLTLSTYAHFMAAPDAAAAEIMGQLMAPAHNPQPAIEVQD